jgi:hypothetical protein
MAAAVHVVEGCWLRRYEGPDRANVQPARTVELSAATSPFVSSGMSALPDEVLRLIWQRKWYHDAAIQLQKTIRGWRRRRQLQMLRYLWKYMSKGTLMAVAPEYQQRGATHVHMVATPIDGGQQHVVAAHGVPGGAQDMHDRYLDAMANMSAQQLPRQRPVFFITMTCES